MIALAGVEVEPRLKQMIRPLSLVLQVFADGEARILAYLQKRQVEIRRERAGSFDGLCFNLALKLAEGAEDLMDDPAFAKYYRHGALQAVEPRMVAALLGTKTPAVSRALRRVGFATTDSKIAVSRAGGGRDETSGGASASGSRTGRRRCCGRRCRTSAVWSEMVQRYYFVEPADPDGQRVLGDDGRRRARRCCGAGSSRRSGCAPVRAVRAARAARRMPPVPRMPPRPAQARRAIPVGTSTSRRTRRRARSAGARRPTTWRAGAGRR